MRIVLLLFVLVGWSGCFQKKTQHRGRAYKQSGMRFEIPSGFQKMTHTEKGVNAAWDDGKADLSLLFLIKWNRDIQFFPLRMALDIQLGKYSTQNKNTSVQIKEITPFKFSETDAFGIKLVKNGLPLRGVYFVANKREFMLLLTSQKKNEKRLEELFKQLVQSLKVTPLKDHARYAKKLLRSQKGLSKKPLKEVLDYGQQLMAGRDMNIRNFPLAIAQFREALEIMKNKEPKPAEYQRALRLITIAKDFQDNVFEKYLTLAKQARSLFHWQEALDAADILRVLFEGDAEDPRAKYAKKLYYHIKKKT